MKIHLVYDSHFEALKIALEENGHEVYWDFSIEQFKIASDGKKVDADVALIDPTAGVSNKQESFELLREVRRNFPNLRIIIQLPEAALNDKKWISKIMGLAIYDIHFTDEFDIDDVERWLVQKLTLADYDFGEEIEGSIQSQAYFKENKEGSKQKDSDKKRTDTKSQLSNFTKLQMTNISSIIKNQTDEKHQQKEDNNDSENIIHADEVEVIAFYSPQPTGKTFVATNFSIAVSKTGREVRYMDCTKHCGSKLWFNPPHFPFTLGDIPLTVSGCDEKGFKSDLVVIETDDKKFIPPNSKLIIVTDSDYAHQVLLSKEILGLSPVGIIWNQENKDCNPEKVFSLPVMLSLPYFTDTNKRIKSGRPRAFDDPQLCEKLISVLNFDVMDHFMLGG